MTSTTSATGPECTGTIEYASNNAIRCNGGVWIQNPDNKYGYAESLHKFLFFGGGLMFIGTLVPELFAIYRRKIKNKLKSAPSDGTDGDPLVSQETRNSRP